MAKKNSEVTYIFRAYITRPDDTRVYAKEYGLKAFPIPVTNNKK